MGNFEVLISKLAFLEIEESKDYYNLQKEGLGNDFKNDIFISLKTISNNPNLYPNIKEKIKRCLLHRFPFSIFYTIKENIVLLSLQTF